MCKLGIIHLPHHIILVNVKIFAMIRSEGAIIDIIVDKIKGPVDPVSFTVIIECSLAIWPMAAMSADCGIKLKYQVLYLNI
jgi:hypothetical protein